MVPAALLLAFFFSVARGISSESEENEENMIVMALEDIGSSASPAIAELEAMLSMSATSDKDHDQLDAIKGILLSAPEDTGGVFLIAFQSAQSMKFFPIGASSARMILCLPYENFYFAILATEPVDVKVPMAMNGFFARKVSIMAPRVQSSFISFLSTGRLARLFGRRDVFRYFWRRSLRKESLGYWYCCYKAIEADLAIRWLDEEAIKVLLTDHRGIIEDDEDLVQALLPCVRPRFWEELGLFEIWDGVITPDFMDTLLEHRDLRGIGLVLQRCKMVLGLRDILRSLRELNFKLCLLFIDHITRPEHAGAFSSGSYSYSACLKIAEHRFDFGRDLSFVMENRPLAFMVGLLFENEKFLAQMRLSDFYSGEVEEQLAVLKEKLDPDEFREIYFDYRGAENIAEISERILAKSFHGSLVPKSFIFEDAFDVCDVLLFENSNYLHVQNALYVASKILSRQVEDNQVQQPEKARRRRISFFLNPKNFDRIVQAMKSGEKCREVFGVQVNPKDLLRLVCVICLEPTIESICCGNSTGSGNCHAYHLHCIFKAFQKENAKIECPQCRKEWKFI